METLTTQQIVESFTTGGNPYRVVIDEKGSRLEVPLPVEAAPQVVDYEAFGRDEADRFYREIGADVTLSQEDAL